MGEVRRLGQNPWTASLMINTTIMMISGEDAIAGSPVEVGVGNAGIVVGEGHIEICVYARHLE